MTEYDVGVTSRVVIKADSKQEAENIAIKNIQNCLEPYYIEADADAQPVKWLMELKDLKVEQNDQYVFIHELMSELKEAKRLLRLAVEDFAKLDRVNTKVRNCMMPDMDCADCPLSWDSVDDSVEPCHNWRYTNEALNLIGDKPNGI